MFRDVAAGVRNIFGARLKPCENEPGSGVSDALAELEDQAAVLGGDAVIGVDVDDESVGQDMLMISVKGALIPIVALTRGFPLARSWSGTRDGSHDG